MNATQNFTATDPAARTAYPLLQIESALDRIRLRDRFPNMNAAFEQMRLIASEAKAEIEKVKTEHAALVAVAEAANVLDAVTTMPLPQKFAPLRHALVNLAAIRNKK